MLCVKLEPNNNIFCAIFTSYKFQEFSRQYVLSNTHTTSRPNSRIDKIDIFTFVSVQREVCAWKFYRKKLKRFLNVSRHTTHNLRTQVYGRTFSPHTRFHTLSYRTPHTRLISLHDFVIGRLFSIHEFVPKNFYVDTNSATHFDR